MKNPKPPFKPKLSLFVGMLLESLSIVLFVIIFQDVTPEFITFLGLSKPILYTGCAIGFGLGFGLVMRNILEYHHHKDD